MYCNMNYWNFYKQLYTLFIGFPPCYPSHSGSEDLRARERARKKGKPPRRAEDLDDPSEEEED